jgi:tetratricopeptide (TPR) repeat protein
MSEPRNQREPSDMFSVRDSGTAIPTITKVPLTKEEVERRRTLRIRIAIASVITTVIVVIIAWYSWHRAALASLRAEAERTGRLTAIDAAIAALEHESGAADTALCARLHAMAELEGETGHRDRALALLAEHDATGDGASDHRIATAYLALAAGDVASALQEVAPLQPSGPRAAESARARALVAAAAGSVDQALAMAQAAANAMPESTRHRALLVEMAGRAGAEAPAAGEGDDATSMHLSRALAVVYRGGVTSDARLEVDAVLAASDATPFEHARATLVKALAAAIEGDGAATRTGLTEVGGVTALSEHARMMSAEGWLLIGSRDEAQAIVTALPSDVTADASLRARLHALLALSTGDANAAATAIATAADSPRRAWVEGRVANARAQLDVARAAFTRASSEGWIGAVAASDLALLEVRAGRGAEAVAAIEPRLAAGATWPRVAAAGALALSAAGQSDRALTVVEAALAAHEGDGGLLAARGRVHLAAQHYGPAVESLTAAITHADGDATLHRDLGLAQRGLGHDAEARTALARSVAIDHTDTTALLPLLTLDVGASDFATARTTLGYVDAQHVASLDVEHLRARVLVGNLAGQSGVRAVLAALRTARRDGELHLALGRLYYQAERWSDAMTELQTAQVDADAHRDAMLWRLIAMGHQGRGRPVEQATDAIRESATTAGITLTPAEEALIALADGWIAVHDQERTRADSVARRVLGIDATSSEAQLILAHNAADQDRDPEPMLRAALAGQPPSVAALGWLALLGDVSPERCDFGRRYVAAAPSGDHARDVRERLSSCPR